MYRSLAVPAFQQRLLHLCTQVTFKPGQKLYIVNGLYPYTLQFREETTSGEKSKLLKRPHQRDTHKEKDEEKEKRCRVSEPSCSNSMAQPEQTRTPEKVSLIPHLLLYLNCLMYDFVYRKESRFVQILKCYIKSFIKLFMLNIY